MELTVIGLAKAVSVFANLDKQVRFASSVAINKTAVLVQNAEYEASNKAFEERSAWGRPKTKYGYNITKYAKKNDADMEAIVGTKAFWVKMQVTGGLKTKDANKYSPQFIPTAAIAQSKGRKVPRQLSITKLKANPVKAHAFQINGNWFRRIGKTIEPIFMQTFTAKIKPVFKFQEVGETVFKAEYPAKFKEAFSMALATAF